MRSEKLLLLLFTFVILCALCAPVKLKHKHNRQKKPECGISHGAFNRVVGGEEAKRGTYPWMAALGVFEDDDIDTLEFYCAGSLISNRYVITGAHCIDPKPNLIRLGAHDLTKFKERNAKDFGIKRIVVHENYNPKSIAIDIALIELNSTVRSTNAIAPICLPEARTFLSQDFIGMHPFVAGWGAVHYGDTNANVLRDVQVPIVNRKICEDSYKPVFKFLEFSNYSITICAGSSKFDACKGDSGGPLMLPQLINGTYRFFLLGIISFGYQCAKPHFPGIYTRVDSFIPWVKKHMKRF